MNPSDEMADAVSQATLGNPYDPTSTQPERFMIDFLVEVLIDWESGTTNTTELLATFDKHDTGSFDIRGFIDDKVKEDVYEIPE